MMHNKNIKKKIIVARDSQHLVKLVNEEIELHGNNCCLNHIVTSKVTDMSWLFDGTSFNGDIDLWDVSNVINMRSMFSKTFFNQDISRWDVSSVTNMCNMFAHSSFNRDIGQWNVSNVTNMDFMFANSVFNQDIFNWRPSKLITKENIFSGSAAGQENKVPYWALADIEFIPNVIEAYHLSVHLTNSLILEGAKADGKHVKI